MAPTAVSSAASSRRPLSAPVWVCSLRDATEAWESVRGSGIYTNCAGARGGDWRHCHIGRAGASLLSWLSTARMRVCGPHGRPTLCVCGGGEYEIGPVTRVCGCYVLMGGARVHVRAVSTTFSTTATAASSSSSSSSTSVLRGLFGVRLRVSRPRTRACRTTTAA